jgi:hypothetical protein
MIRTSALLCALLLGSGLAAAQMPPPAPGINRNPAWREQLPPNPVPPPDARDTVVPNPGPGDPRDSDTRPVQPLPGPAAPRDSDTRPVRPLPGPAAPASAPGSSTGPTYPVPPEPARR